MRWVSLQIFLVSVILEVEEKLKWFNQGGFSYRLKFGGTNDVISSREKVN